MAYIIIAIAMIGIILQKRLGASRSMRRTNVLFLLYAISFLVLSTSTGVYMARHNIYISQLHNYIGISRSMWGMWSLSVINLDALIRSIVLFSCCVPLINFALALSLTYNWKKLKKLWFAIALVYIPAILVFDPDMSVWIYRYVYPSYISYVNYHRALGIISVAARCLNISLIVLEIALISAYICRLPKYQELWRGKLSVYIGDLALSISYLVLFSWAPCALVKYSRLIEEKTYLTISLDKQIMLAPVFTSFQVVIFILMALGLIIDAVIQFRISQFSRQSAMSRNSIHAVSRILMHYVKNEILAIENEVEIARLRTTPDAKDRALDRIQTRCDKIWAHIETARNQSQGTRLLLEQVNLKKLVMSVLDKQADRLRGFRVDVRIDDSLTLQLDHTSFSEVMENLIVNAVEASLDIAEQRRFIEISADIINRYVRIRVKDHGCGIDEEMKSIVFSPYFSNKPTSSNWGLGLTLCRAVISAHRGIISIDSHPNRGATFTLLLPYGETEDDE